MTDLEVALAQHVQEADRAELPGLLGRLVELEALVRLRLAEAPTAPAPSPSRLLTAAEAAVVAGTTKRWLLSKTRGMKFRQDLSRKQPRFEEAGLRRWLEGRRR